MSKYKVEKSSQSTSNDMFIIIRNGREVTRTSKEHKVDEAIERNKEERKAEALAKREWRRNWGRR